MQAQLAKEFTNAINVELKSDTLLTESYLEAYLPKKLASFGLAIVNLVMTNMRAGIGGKSYIELSLDPATSSPDDEIKTGSLRVGDIVLLDRMTKVAKADGDKTALDGVVTKMSAKTIVVSVDEDTSDERLLALYNNTDNDNVRMWVVKLTNYVTYRRMLQAMKRLETFPETSKTEVIRILLGEASFTPSKGKHSKMDFFDSNLNASQRNAVEFAIHESPITIIHGPPGTGKTYTLIELIKQLTFHHNERVLVCGASNISVDNILERLSPVFSSGGEEEQGVSQKKSRRKGGRNKQGNPEQLIRIGHPARLLEANHKHSLDVLSKSSSSVGDSGDPRALLRDIEKDIASALQQIKKAKRFGERRELWGEVKALRKDLRRREKDIVRELLRSSKVVLATLHGAGSNELFGLYGNGEYSVDNPFFDTIIIDEVSQSLEPQCWIALATHLGFKRLVIAGDNLQLPATVKSKEEADKLRHKKEPVADLEYTLFDRLMEKHNGQEYKKLLDVQYRMNKEIMEFSSQQMYQGQLRADTSVEGIRVNDLPDVETTDDTASALVWYDTQGGDFPEKLEDTDSAKNILAQQGSKFNDMEAAVVMEHVQKLKNAGVKAQHIGVISPYSAQVEMMKKALRSQGDDGIEVSTIDGFQGREKEIIIVSLVRSNDERDIGFLADSRRLNVAMTRPKRQLCIIGDMETLERSGNDFLQQWVKYSDENSDLRYPDAVAL